MKGWDRWRGRWGGLEAPELGIWERHGGGVEGGVFRGKIRPQGWSQSRPGEQHRAEVPLSFFAGGEGFF